jgi:hypothetical protein
MKTISDLPATDPSVQRVLNSLWIGHIKIKPDTVLDPVIIKKQIAMFETADVCNSWEAASVSQSIEDLKQILSYLT